MSPRTDLLNSLSTPEGVIAALAMDQRRSLRRMIASAAGVQPEQIADAQLTEFKAAVTAELSPHASAVLLDPDYGMQAVPLRHPRCGLLLAYELDGFENPRPYRMLALTPGLSALRLREMGAQGIKILLSYTPFGDPEANDEKCALIERIGHECEAAGIPFFLEPVGYDPGGLDPMGPDYARIRPEVVIRSMEEFSKDRYRVDVLKVEFPVNARFVEGSAVFGGVALNTMREALDLFRRADEVARRPYIYLSAGVHGAQFVESLRMATEAGARYSGVLCGRAHWQDGVAAYARGGRGALEEWLRSRGAANMRSVNECLRSAVPWWTRGAPR